MTSQQIVPCKLTHDICTTHVHVVHENCERVDGQKPLHMIVAQDSCKQKIKFCITVRKHYCQRGYIFIEIVQSVHHVFSKEGRGV